MRLIISSLGGIELSLLKILKTQDWGNFLPFNLVAQALNTSPEIVKTNYLNYSDEWTRNRFRVLGYDKRALP